MSEYPVHCDNCGKYIGYVHATEWSSSIICDECSTKLKEPTKRAQEKTWKK